MTVESKIEELFPQVLAAWRAIETEEESEKKRIFEIVRRINKLERIFTLIQPINNELCNSANTMSVDVGANEIVFQSPLGGEPNRIQFDGSVKDIEIKTLSMGYLASNPDWFDDPLLHFKLDMEIYIDSLYYNAHRIIDEINKNIKVVSNFDFKSVGVSVVRNKLLEHDNDQVLYNFAATVDGPVVKPARRGSDSKEWIDSGLYPNLFQLLELLIAKIK